MSRPPRSSRVPAPPINTHYSTVPTSPRSPRSASRPYTPPVAASPARSPSRPQTRQRSSRSSHRPRPLQLDDTGGDTVHNVATGHIGGGYGPYVHHQPHEPRSANRFTTVPSDESHDSPDKALPGPPASTATVPPYIWDTKDLDDALHNIDPVRDAMLDRRLSIFSARGWLNIGTIVIIIVALITLFAAYPVINFYLRGQPPIFGFNLGGINSSGQVPDLPGVRGLVDPDTPDEAKNRVGLFDGQKYNLVFSDEFNIDGRSFYPGDDPFWEAVDLNYWATGDLEWYSPEAITTKNGNLVITMTEQLNHDLNFQSGMLQSWNKLCFTTGILEISISLPGSGNVPGFWPGAWMMGNLGRAGYGASTEGTWPYSYDTCDVGTFPNQTRKDGTPAAAATSGANGGPLSFLPGQKLSACTCPGMDHPGPNVGRGRGAPEIDIIEAQVDTARGQGQASQSYQTAPYNAFYQYVNTTPAATIYDPTITTFNSYKGGPYQQAVSAVSYVDNAHYGGNGFGTYGVEWWADRNHRQDGFVNWYQGSDKMWTMTAAAVARDPLTEVDQRPVAEEPMSIILNFGLSPGFQKQDWKHLPFPSHMLIDYVRLYQRNGVNNIGCSPSDYPTADYINNHINAYTDANLTTWDGAGYTFPRNSMYDGC